MNTRNGPNEEKFASDLSHSENNINVPFSYVEFLTRSKSYEQNYFLNIPQKCMNIEITEIKF